MNEYYFEVSVRKVGTDWQVFKVSPDGNTERSFKDLRDALKEAAVTFERERIRYGQTDPGTLSRNPPNNFLPFNF